MNIISILFGDFVWVEDNFVGVEVQAVFVVGYLSWLL